VTASPESKQVALVAAQAALDKLATNVVVLDVSSHLPLADIFVVCSAANSKQVSAVVDSVEDRLREFGTKPIHREGRSGDDWILLSYPEIVVHVQLPEARDFYRLENLWNDCPAVPIPAPVGERS
jgi:ribosome-associated protein